MWPSHSMQEKEKKKEKDLSSTEKQNDEQIGN